jgi:hypothetical protein
MSKLGKAVSLSSEVAEEVEGAQTRGSISTKIELFSMPLQPFQGAHRRSQRPRSSIVECH